MDKFEVAHQRLVEACDSRSWRDDPENPDEPATIQAMQIALNLPKQEPPARTEVLEAEEFFSAGQKGSSAMPHKRNPILTENLTGLARLVRSSVVPAMENVALWHERDISHSSVERGIGPDATIHLDFALHRLANVVERLNVYPENMQKNIDRLGGLVHSQRVMLALTQAGVSREDAYAAVQENAMKVWRGEGAFLDFLKADDRVTLPADQLEALFDLGYHTKNVDVVFKWVFGEG